MASPRSSSSIKSPTPESNIVGGMPVEHTEAALQKSQLFGPVAILWDIENCPVPNDVRAEDVAGNIRMALRVHPVIRGAVTMFSAYGDFNAFPRKLREGCQRTGVKLVDVPNGRKDAADKAILVDMFLFALDNRPPSSIMLISGDVDFSAALHILGQRGYTIILAIPSGVRVSSALSNAGRFVWDWPSVVRGEGFVPLRSSVPCNPDIVGQFSNFCLGANPDAENDEEAIVYRGTGQYDCSTATSSSQVHSFSAYQGPAKPSSFTFVDGRHLPSMKCPNIQSGCGTSETKASEHGSPQDDELWVRPGDLQGLETQLIRLIEISGGSIPLVRIPSEYFRTYGRPLYMAEYGVCKLVHLLKKMEHTLVVVGKGHSKLVRLQNHSDVPIKTCCVMPPMAMKKKKRTGILGENTVDTSSPLRSSSDDYSDDESSVNACLEHAAYNYDSQLQNLRMEVQELLVCYSCPVPLSSFEVLYEKRYKKALSYQSYGVDGLENLITKINDVVEVKWDPNSKQKFLMSH